MTARVVIRQASLEDLPSIVAFLRDHWRADHVFVRAPELLTWQHTDPDDPHLLTFVLALSEGSGSSVVLGLLGFLPFRRFDPARHWDSLSLAIWRVRDDAGRPGLGLQLLSWIVKNRTPAMICAIGVSDMVVPIYQAYGYTVGTLTQAALFGSRRCDPAVAMSVPPEAFAPVARDPAVTLDAVTLSDGDDPAFRDDVNRLGTGVIPEKSWPYLVGRFLTHPVYTYDVRALRVDGVMRAILVMRKVTVEVEARSRSILRIVDFLGDDNVLSRAGGSLRALVDEEDCEYVDIMQYGMKARALAEGRFVESPGQSGLVLPNYFEPFERRRIEVKLAVKTRESISGAPIRLLRADSDQDRPNHLATR